jgi:hypothetical protein
MTKLLKSHRGAITDHLLSATFRERELRLRQREHALGLKLLRALYGDDALRRMAELPEGWLPLTSSVSFSHTSDGGYLHHTSVGMSDPVRVPASHSYPDAPPGWVLLWTKLKDQRTELNAERLQIELEIRGTLAAFTTVEKLAEGWPEGYAHFPHPELAPTNLPALRIEDLNARLAAAREAA